MKFFSKLAIIAAATLGMAAPAAAQTVVNINLGATQTNQALNGNVTQRALSVAAAVGSTGSEVDVSSAAVSAANLATQSMDVVQDGSTLANGNAAAMQANQVVNGVTDQASASIAGTGNLGSLSTISSTAANLGNSANVSVTVRQGS